MRQPEWANRRAAVIGAKEREKEGTWIATSASWRAVRVSSCDFLGAGELSRVCARRGRKNHVGEGEGAWYKLIRRVSPSVRTNDSQPVDLFPTLDLSLLISRQGKFLVFPREGLSYPGMLSRGKASNAASSNLVSIEAWLRSMSMRSGCFIACWPSTIIPSIYLSGFTPLCISFCLFLPFVHLSIRLAFNLYKRAVSAELVRASPPPMQRRASKSRYPVLANINAAGTADINISSSIYICIFFRTCHVHNIIVPSRIPFDRMNHFREPSIYFVLVLQQFYFFCLIAWRIPSNKAQMSSRIRRDLTTISRSPRIKIATRSSTHVAAQLKIDLCPPSNIAVYRDRLP